MGVTLSDHGEVRLKQRLGLNRKAARRHAQRAFERGQFPKDYPCRQIALHYDRLQRAELDKMYLIYHDLIHIFVLKDGQPNLVTAYDPLSVMDKSAQVW